MPKNIVQPQNAGTFVAKGPYVKTQKKAGAKKQKGGDLRSKASGKK